ncbi:MAG TPA: pilus assembly protein [Firmicutes bacterium]|nr:pilus assembly protein [Bacillota bacterium]
MLARDEGSALLELCLVLPILLVFFLGLLSFTLHAIESQMLHFSAYVAARTALVDSAAKGERAAAQFLAGSRNELFWLAEPSREMAGRELTVTKRQDGVAVQIGRRATIWPILVDLFKGGFYGGSRWRSGLSGRSDLFIEYRLGRL